MDDQQQRRRTSALMTSALTVLIDRAGGSVTIPREEFVEVAERYGGHLRVSVMCEQDQVTGTWTLRLVSKQLEAAKLPM